MSVVMQLNLTSQAQAFDRDLPRASFGRVQIDEPLVLLVGKYDSWSHLNEMSGELGQALCGQKTALVRMGELSGGAVEALSEVSQRVDRLVLIMSPEQIAVWPAGDRKHLADWVQAGVGKVVIEPSFERAVVAAMQWLGRGDSLALLCPAEQSLAHATAALRHGAAWRASFQNLDDACF